MAEGSDSTTDSGGAGTSRDVFLSYASADAAMAQAVCRGLEGAGIACWIAPRDVTPGAQYADAIVRAINGAKVLVVVLSEHSVDSAHVGKEIERASAKRRPIIALRIDGAPLTPALEYFLSESQWIEAPGGGLDAALPRLDGAVRRLLHSAPREFEPRHADLGPGHPTQAAPAAAGTRHQRRLVVVAAVVIAIAAMAAGWHWFGSNGAGVAPMPPAPPPQAATPAAAAFSPPPHSVAVLPFVNMSGDKEQDYFSDGLSEELLNALVTIPDLQVAARTSSFSFKGSTADTGEIARKLNVGAILEGSVRKQGTQVRITAQLINAVTGFHLWSKTYDRDLKDVLKLQTEVATEVTSALQGTLLGNASAHADLGGTQNPQAFDAFLRAEKLRRSGPSKEHDLALLALYDEALRLDPKFAKAYIGKAMALTDLANYQPPAQSQESIELALAQSRKALELAPDLGTAHSTYARGLSLRYDFVGAVAENTRATVLAPGDATVMRESAVLLSSIGQGDLAIEQARRAVALDPLNPQSHRSLGDVFTDQRRYAEAVTAFDQAISLNPENTALYALRGNARYLQGEFEAARKDCETPPLDWPNRVCLAVVYDRLHRPADAKAALEALHATVGDTAAYQYLQIYAQWGESGKALDWMDTAYRLRDPGLTAFKVDAFLDPVRNEPRYIEMAKKLKFPD
jgi:TolB-like protein/Tfp pilus assembly protein PilF